MARRIEMVLSRHAFIGIAVASLIVMIPHVLHLPAWLSLVFVGLLGWRYLLNTRGRGSLGWTLRISLPLLLIGAIVAQYGSLLGREPGTALLAGLTAMKLLEARTRRDYMLTIFLLYLLIAADFLAEQGLIHGLYMVISTFAVTTALVLLNEPKADRLKANVRMASGLLVKAIPLMIVMYVLFPRLQGGLWGLPPDAHRGQTGLSEVMRPGAINELAQSDAVAFRVEFDAERPKASTLYWRAMLMWQTDGFEWRPGNLNNPDAEEPVVTGQPIAYTITLEPHNKRWLMTLDRPLNIPKGAQAVSGYLRWVHRPITKRVRYKMISASQHRTGMLSRAERFHGLELPKTISPRVHELAQRLRSEAGSDAAFVQAAFNYFRIQNFSYTLRPPLMGANPIDEFLFTHKRGFCGHFSAAYVTLMRAAGVPARVVTGYQGGRYSEVGNYLIVRQSDAHAWAEVWLEGRGWLRIDPTAAVSPERIELGIDAIRRIEDEGVPRDSIALSEPGLLARIGWSLREYWDYANIAWFRWIADYDWDRQNDLLKRLGMTAPSWLGLIVGAIGTVGIMLLGLALIDRQQRLHKDPLGRAWLRFCRRLARAGIQRASWEGPHDFALRASAKRPDLAPVITDMSTRFIALRYGEADNREAVRAFIKEIDKTRIPKKAA